ncbi:MAG: hypothetical protein HYZ45_10690 [Burkholderiales bacterium]|nr:hypothetical protein [Burkholderiales bacterium]
MNTVQTDTRIDRLYELLPAIYRMRDAEQNYKLQALLRVIAEQVNLLEDDIAQLYENWFIETAQDWVVPYLADLVGVTPVADPGLFAELDDAQSRALARVLVPRREAANTVYYRRRKGSLALLETIAHDVAQWPARAQEFYRLLGWHQHLNHQHQERARTVDLHAMAALDLIGTPFEQLAHSVDVRRISDRHQQGLMNPAAIGMFIWRLKVYSSTLCAAYCHEKTGPHCYTFSVLGQDMQLYIKPQQEADATTIAAEINTPSPLRRRALQDDLAQFYGAEKSLAIWTNGWADYPADQVLPSSAIIVADLSDWKYVPPLKHIALDPVLGRIAFPPTQLPKKGVKVNYHYAFSNDIGGGEYRRRLEAPLPRLRDGVAQAATLYTVGKGQALNKICDALAKWEADAPQDAIIEIVDSAVYTEPLAITLQAGQTLQLRAASGVRPVIRLLDWQTDLPDSFGVKMSGASRLLLDGLLILGCSVHIDGIEREAEDGKALCGAELQLHHCTLVPGWGLECDCEPKRPAEPSLELFNLRTKVRIESCIIGSIQIQEDEVHTDPLELFIRDSIVDAAAPFKEAIGAIDASPAFCTLTIERSTVFGITNVHALALAQDSIFTDCLNVARRQVGCMRFCYVKPGCRTPRRYHCQPDLALAALTEQGISEAEMPAARAREVLRLAPQFTSERYGHPAYAQLGTHCADEIKQGALDESEMGVFHDLYQPQRYANLLARLQEYTVAGMEVGILFVN